MKALHLIKRELKLLKKTVIIITLIFTAFLCALFGIISVQTDLSRGIYDNIDSSDTQLQLTVQNASWKELQSELDGVFVTAQSKGITRSATLTTENGTAFTTNLTAVEDGVTVIENYNGAVICLNECALLSLQTCSYTLLQGSWMAGENEICLSSYVADYLNVTAGNVVYIQETAYAVTGVYLYYSALGYYLVTVSSGTVLDTFTAHFTGCEVMYSAFTKLNAKGFSAKMPTGIESYLENLSYVKWFLTACGILLFIVVFAVLYSLISVFYRQRKGYICQLKVLGATEYTVAKVYCGIAFLMLFASALIATLLALLFSRYVMALCAKLFDMAFAAHFNFIVPLVIFGLLCLIALVIYLIFARKTKSASVAQEIRHE